MKSVGIDIGSYQIKVVELQTSGKNFQITRYFTQALSQNFANQTDQELEIIEFLRKLVATYDPTQTRFVVGLRQDRVAIRLKSFPFSERLKIMKSLPFELEEDLPFSPENAIFDGKVIRSLGNTAEVLACATPKSHVEHLLRLMGDCSISPHVISSEATAFANLFEQWQAPIPSEPNTPVLEEGAPLPARQVQLVMHIGHRRTFICAFEKQSLIAVRTILWGGKNIADAIAKKYSLAPAEAQKEFESKGFILTGKQDTSYDAKIFSDLISKSVRELIRDLQLTILELKSEINAQVFRLDLTGGVANMHGLGPFMTQHLEIPVNRLLPLDLFSGLLIEKNDFTQAHLSIAIGLAIDGLRKPRNPSLNFMKGEFARQNNFFPNLWRDWSGVVKWTAASLVLLTAWSYLRNDFAIQLEEASQENLKLHAKNVARLTGKNATEAKVKQYIKDNRKKVQELKTLKTLADMNSGLDLVAKLSDSVPVKTSIQLDVRRARVIESDLVLEGYVKNQSELSLLQQSLLSMAVDGKVTQMPVTLPAANGFTPFALALKVDRNINKVAR